MTTRTFLKMIGFAILFAVIWVGCCVEVAARAYVRWPGETTITLIALGLFGFVVLSVVRGARGQF